MVLAILQYLVPAERLSNPDLEQEKGFVTILRHAGFHGGSKAAVFEPTCVLQIRVCYHATHDATTLQTHTHISRALAELHREGCLWR